MAKYVCSVDMFMKASSHQRSARYVMLVLTSLRKSKKAKN